MTAELVSESVLSDPCSRRRHSRCQLPENCACLCHVPGPRVHPDVDSAESFNDAIFVWLRDLDGEMIVPVEAQRFVDYMRERDPSRLSAWLDEHATGIVRDRMKDLVAPSAGRSRRGRRSPTQASRFDDAAEAFERGDPNAFDELEVSYLCDALGHRRVLAAMTHQEVGFAAERTERRGKAALLDAAFLRAVQKRVPDDETVVVGDVFTSDELSALRQAAA